MHNPCITLYIPRRKYPYNMPYTSEMSQRTSVLLYALHLANCTRAIPISSAATSFPTLSTSLIFLALLGRRPSPTLLILSSATLRSLATPSASPSASAASCFPAASTPPSTSSTLALHLTLLIAHSSLTFLTLPRLLCDPRFLLVPPPHEFFLLHSCPLCFLLFLLNFPQTLRRLPRKRLSGFPLLLLDRQ